MAEGLLARLDAGAKLEIAEDDYDHFLDVLPPVAYRFSWNHERWDFGFAEGHDHVYAFKKEGGRCFAQKTRYLNPRECGRSLVAQAGLLVRQALEEKEAARATQWLPTWLRLGKRNPWIADADDPPFTLKSFHACRNMDELLDKFAHGNWCLGQAFYLGDLCFIQQVDGGDEWLTIKQSEPFESISFGNVIAKRGREEAAQLIERLQHASLEQCSGLSY